MKGRNDQLAEVSFVESSARMKQQADKSRCDRLFQVGGLGLAEVATLRATFNSFQGKSKTLSHVLWTFSGCCTPAPIGKVAYKI